MSEQPTNQESFEEMFARQEAAAPRLEPGQKVKGKIIDISGDSVFVDLGAKQDGALDRAEILDRDGNPQKAVGDEIEAWIIGIDSQGVRLSSSMQGGGVEALIEAMNSGVPAEGKVKAVCKGGYEVNILGKRAFCPGSQMELASGEEPEAAVGRQMQFLITRVENNGRNIVVSRRSLIDRDRKANLAKLLETLKVGDTVEGTVARLAPYGAFVELAPLVEGLVHISELSWSRVASPDEAVSVGEKVRAKVESIVEDDKGQTRIGLSVRHAQGDPWETVGERFKPGEIVDGVVRRLAPFGAFVEIAPGIEGLAHISELSWEKRIAKPEEVLALGDAVSVKIKEINPETKRIALSLKDAQGDPWQDASEKFLPGAKVSGQVESRNQHGLFVRLAPGLTGLLPQGALAKAPAGDPVAKAGAGDTVEVVIRSIDPVSKRISLNLAASADAASKEEDDRGWRQHASLKKPDQKGDSGIMAEALRKAFQKNEGK